MITILIRGAKDTGKTTAANLIKAHLEDLGYKRVNLQDQNPTENKDDLQIRLARNQDEPVNIVVEVVNAEGDVKLVE